MLTGIKLKYIFLFLLLTLHSYFNTTKKKRTDLELYYKYTKILCPREACLEEKHSAETKQSKLTKKLF